MSDEIDNTIAEHLSGKDEGATWLAFECCCPALGKSTIFEVCLDIDGDLDPFPEVFCPSCKAPMGWVELGGTWPASRDGYRWQGSRRPSRCLPDEIADPIEAIRDMADRTEKALTDTAALIGHLSRAVRTQAGLSLEQAAAKMGVEPSTLQAIERGQRIPSREGREALARLVELALSGAHVVSRAEAHADGE